MWLYQAFVWKKVNQNFPKPKNLLKKHPFIKLKEIILKNKFLFIGVLFFILAATISIFTSTNLRSALGEWKAFYIEPILIFLILISTIETKTEIKNILFAVILGATITGIFAIIQHFTGWMVPHDFWANRNTYRVTAWYGYPNAIGLFLAPIIPLVFYFTKYKTIKSKSTSNLKNYCSIFSLQSSLIIIVLCMLILAIVFAKSTGALIGIVIELWVIGIFYKKTRWLTLGTALIGIIIFAALPSTNSLKQDLLFKDKSGQIRIAMWSETVDFLKDHPLAGAGLASYSQKIEPYHKTVDGAGVEIFHLPHNIFLALWVNIGLLGLLGFLFIIIWFYQNALHNLESKKNQLKILLTSSMTILLVMGLVDTPYIKNDLAIFFWLLPALLITTSEKQLQS